MMRARFSGNDFMGDVVPVLSGSGQAGTSALGGA
jgi:hypothetical protein